MPTLIRFNKARRGNLGGNRYRDFEEGETYAVDEKAGPPDTITPFLADQFVDAGDAVEVDADDAPVKSTETLTQTPDDDEAEKAAAEKAAAEKAAASSDDKPLAEKTVEELKEMASELEIDGRSKLTTKDDLVEAIEKARAEKAADAK